MYCENCGKKRQFNENFCIECGNKYINNECKKNNTILILGILSCILVPIPIISLPLAIISIVLGVKKKDKGLNLIPAIVSLIIMIIEIITVLVLVLAYDELKNNIYIEEFENLFEENYYYEENHPTEESFDIKGYDWIGDDNSVLRLNQNLNYIWYQNSTDQSNNYYQGNYEVYNGNEAISYITNSLQAYGITEAEQRKNIANSNHSIQEYYLIILNCETMIINGIEQQPSNKIVYYYGYYESESKYLNLTNIQTKNQVGFTLKITTNTTQIAKKYHF